MSLKTDTSPSSPWSVPISQNRVRGNCSNSAREHVVKNHLATQNRIGRGEALPLPDHSFDMVACCDVLET